MNPRRPGPLNGEGRRSATAPELTPASQTGLGLECPYGHGPLKYPETVGVCLTCGYSRAQGTVVNRPQEAKPPARSDFVEFLILVRKLPPWVWVLVGGMVLLVLGSLTASHYYLGKQTLDRALFSTVELAAGIILCFAGQTWGMILCRRDEGGMGLIDTVYPFRVWPACFSRLPLTRWPVLCLSWGVVSILCSTLIVGGLFLWIPKHLKPYANKKPHVPLRFNVSDEEDLSLDEAIQAFAETADLSDDKPEADDDQNPDKPKPEELVPQNTECLIIGYMQSDEGTLTGVVLATRVDDELKYAGSIESGFTPKQSETLRKVLVKLVRKTPPVSGVEFKAVWVQPRVACTVHNYGPDANGLLRKPKIVSLVDANTLKKKGVWADKE